MEANPWDMAMAGDIDGAVVELAKSTIAYQREQIKNLRAALEAQQVYEETKAENYRQSDNGWLPSPGWPKVSYPDTVAAETLAVKLRYDALNMDYAWKIKAEPSAEEKPSNLTPHYWIVQRRPKSREHAADISTSEARGREPSP